MELGNEEDVNVLSKEELELIKKAPEIAPPLEIMILETNTKSEFVLIFYDSFNQPKARALCNKEVLEAFIKSAKEYGIEASRDE
jgi:hypothetical protein